jgi:hypothetical protein
MMKNTKLFRGLLITMILVLSSSTVVSARPLAATSKSLSTNYTLVNLDQTQDATVTATYNKPDGSTWVADPANTSFSVAKNFGQKIIAQYYDNTLSGGSGSVLISSNTQLGAVVQVMARNQTPSSDAYIGVATPADTYYVPQVLKNRTTASGIANTQITIQNASGGAAITGLIVHFIASPGAGFSNYDSSAIAINANGSYVYDVSNESHLPDNWFGSAVVNSDTGKNIAVVISLFTGPNSLQTLNGFDVNSPFTGWSIPQFTSRLTNGLSTPIVVQNLSGSTITANSIVVDCQATSSAYTPASFEMKNTTDVPNTANYAFNPVTDTTLPNNWSGSCILNSSGKVVVFVQIRQPGMNDNYGGYQAFRTDSTFTRVVVPLMSKIQSNGFATAAIIQNLDTANAADVTLTYNPSVDYVSAGGSSTPIVIPATIPAGANIIQSFRLLDSVPQVPQGWYGTLVVTPKDGSPARPIVGYVQLTNVQNLAGDTFMAHDAFMLP